MSSSAAPRQPAPPAPDPALAGWLAQVNAAQARLLGVTPSAESVRIGLAGMTRSQGGHGPALPAVCDLHIGPGDIPVRLYDACPDKAKPVCVYLHGGGHVAGSIDVYDAICRRLAATSGRLVASVEYRLAPEHPYPAGLADALAVLRALPAALAEARCRVMPRMALAGDSGGGALAATVASLVRTHPDIALDRLVLIYPSLDYTLAYPSVRENGHGYLLETEKIRWYFDQYFQHGEDRRAASPLHLPAEGLPPTLVITAGLCPLRDEALAYVERLAAVGVAHRHLAMPDMIHAYLNLHDLVPQACAYTFAAIGEFLQPRAATI